MRSETQSDAGPAAGMPCALCLVTTASHDNIPATGVMTWTGAARRETIGRR